MVPHGSSQPEKGMGQGFCLCFEMLKDMWGGGAKGLSSLESNPVCARNQSLPSGGGVSAWTLALGPRGAPGGLAGPPMATHFWHSSSTKARG